MAYIAGMFDRRSVIAAMRTYPESANKHKGNNRKSEHYNIRVEFRLKEKILANVLQRAFKFGTLVKGKNYSNPDKPYWSFMAWSKNGAKVLEKLLPHLKLKRPQALLLLELHEDPYC